MRNNYLFACLLAPFTAFSQLNINYQVNTSAGQKPISPYIYGMCNGGYDQATIRRQGGNRMTGYNWENNASHAGADWFYQNDDYLPWVMGIPTINYNDPGIVTTTFHNQSLAHGALSAITLQMAGYVARDKNGTTVETWEAAPSNRWVQVQNQKPTAFSLVPDLNDNIAYMDEYMNFLINEFGDAASSTGIKAYILDNEAGLWTSTHPRLYTGPISCADHLNRSLALARRVREMDANALIFGPESYGYSEYLNFQGAGDWSNYSGQYSHYLSAYLDSMADASATVGSRLLDVMTVHWYPDVYAGSVYSQDTSAAIAAERMQVARSLWDSTYVEDGWIGQWFSQDLPILPKLKSLISTYYPGTKLGVTEYDYGGDAHISGGIAEVEALGAFARTGTEYATKWGEFSDYSLSAIQLYRNVADPFGDTYVSSNSTNRTHSNVFASIVGNDDSELHIIVTNKSADSTIQAQFNIASGTNYDAATLYSFTQNNASIQTQALPASILQPGGFSYTLQPLTAYHFVLKNTSVSGINEQQAGSLTCFPNPSEEYVIVRWEKSPVESIEVTDISGTVISRIPVAGLHEWKLNTASLAPGVYFVRGETKTGVQQAIFVRK